MTILDDDARPGFLSCSTVSNLVTESAGRAVLTVNRNGGSYAFACDATMVVPGTLLVARPLTLDAAGRDVTISGAGMRRIFSLASGARLHLIGLTLADGVAVGTNSPSVTSPGETVEGGAVLVAVQSTSDWALWTDVETKTPGPDGLVVFAVSTDKTSPTRFYRVIAR